MSNRPVRLKATFGLPVTGVTAMMSGIITGRQATGLHRRQLVCFGLRPIGAGTMARTPSTRVTGDRRSVFMEALITVMATPEMVTGADDGKETASVTTPL